MPIAAVPRYLGQEFASASPGMRFGMYLAIWTDRYDQKREVRKAAQRRSPEAMTAKLKHVRGALSFWDVIPAIPGDHLKVEIMAPYQSHYYQKKGDPKSGNSTSPHDSGQPNPSAFLTVPPGSQFTSRRLRPSAPRASDGEPCRGSDRPPR
jgi:CRISPR/Cas system CMR subunit Cmr6 (Cas7 group RAMP superfamily)